MENIAETATSAEINSSNESFLHSSIHSMESPIVVNEIEQLRLENSTLKTTNETLASELAEQKKLISDQAKEIKEKTALLEDMQLTLKQLNKNLVVMH